MNNKFLYLLNDLLEEAKKLSINDDRDITIKRSEMIAKKVFGDHTTYIDKLSNISFRPGIVYSGMDRRRYHEAFDSGKQKLINLINVMLEDLTLSIKMSDSSNLNELPINDNSKKIFVVHGHNEEMKQSIARFLEKMGFIPVILHEQPNHGRTIIEKFINYADVSFAIILLSADDVAFKKTDRVKNAKLRARQNVIFELGFFLGKLGRERVLAIHEKVDNFELPSDYNGVTYYPFDGSDYWKLAIAKELKALGFELDAERLLQ